MPSTWKAFCRSRQILAIGTGLAISALVSPGDAADSSCSPSTSLNIPADGHWKGSLQINYQAQVDDGSFEMKFGGDLDFTLKTDKPPKEWVSAGNCPTRIPLGGRPIPGCDEKGNVIGHGPAGYLRDNYNELLRRHLNGTAEGSIHQEVAQAADVIGGSDQRFLLGKLSEIVDTPAGPLVGILMERPDLSGTSFFDGKKKSIQAGARGETPVRLFIEKQDCSIMQGSADTQALSEAMKGAGMIIESREANWEATLEHDPTLEKEVDRFLQQPIPQQIGWDDIDRTTAEFQRILGDKSSDYRICEANKVLSKLNQILARGAQNLLDDYPRVDQGATAPVLCAANDRIVGLARQLALLGFDCSFFTVLLERAFAEQDALAAKLRIPSSSLTCSSR